MIQTSQLLPGVSLHTCTDHRFKQGCISFQLVRPMCHKEAAMNALIPAILLRGCACCPDLRTITQRLDDLYGAAVGTLVRRVGDYQTTGLCCNFIDEAYALPGDRLLEPMVSFLGQLLLAPVTENGIFLHSYVEGEKRNLLSAIEAQKNDKRFYASQQLFTHMCKNDSFSVPRLGTAAQVEAVTAADIWAHYQHILKTSPIEIFYLGAADHGQIARLVTGLLGKLERTYTPLPPQSGFTPCPAGTYREEMDVSQGKLYLGFTTPITLRDPEFVAMQVCNTVFGSGMTGKLFTVIREKMSLCYDIGSTYHGSKGIVTVGAGIDFDKEEQVVQEVMHQLQLCRQNQISDTELTSAKQAIISQLKATHDSPGAIENYYGTVALSGLALSPAQYIAAVEQVTREQVAAAAQTLELHTRYFLKGVQ